MNSMQQRYGAAVDVTLVAFFVLLISLPLVLQLFLGEEKAIQEEQRNLRQMPSLRLDTWTAKEFPRLFEGYYTDHFRLRRSMVRAHHLVKMRLFHDSPSEAVILGKNDWLFYDGRFRNDGDPVADYRGTSPLAEDQCLQWRAVVQARASWLEPRGSLYLFVVAPNKETIYPEHMPDRFRPLSANSPMNQLTGYAGGIGNLGFCDLRRVLKEAAGRHQVYAMTDTHWNSYGAFVAYDAIMRTVSGRFPTAMGRPADDFAVSHGQQRGGDLAGLLALSDRLVEPSAPVFRPRFARRATLVPGPAAGDREWVVDDPALPTAVVFHDSFGNALTPFLVTHFRRIVFRVGGGEFDKDLIEKVKPQFVMTILSERSLRVLCAPSSPPATGPSVP